MLELKTAGLTEMGEFNALPFPSSKNLKFGHFTSGKEMNKKAWCTCRAVVLPTKLIAF